MSNIKVQWVKYKSHEGCRHMGNHKFNPLEPWGPWTKIMGVVARCEGNHDTVVSYDRTGVTWGFLQWTFTAGRLQKLLESFKSISHYDFTIEDNPYDTLFDDLCCHKNGYQLFESYGFKIRGGKFVELDTGNGERILNPANQKKRIDDICMGRESSPKLKDQKRHAMDLARLFIKMGKDPAAAVAQIEFGKQEFKRSLDIKRGPLGEFKTIRNLISTSDRAFTLPIAAIFFNLWQNLPGGAYTLFKNVWKKAIKQGVAIEPGNIYLGREEDFLDILWRQVNQTGKANWGWKSKRYLANKRGLKPRVYRLQKGIKEFYDLDLPFYK